METQFAQRPDSNYRDGVISTQPVNDSAVAWCVEPAKRTAACSGGERDGDRGEGQADQAAVIEAEGMARGRSIVSRCRCVVRRPTSAAATARPRDAASARLCRAVGRPSPHPLSAGQRGRAGRALRARIGAARSARGAPRHACRSARRHDDSTSGSLAACPRAAVS